MKIKSGIFIIALIGAVNTGLHLISGLNFEPHRDELLYFSFCNHLDFGYATSPPLVGFLAFIPKSIWGYSLFSVRLLPALTSGMLVILSALMAKELKGKFQSQLLSAIGVSATMFLATVYGIFTPYCFDIFFWTLILFLIIRFINSGKNKYLILLGITIGFSILNKYNVIFLLTAIILVLPFTRYRIIFSNNFFYIGLALAVAIASPNIIWQIGHQLPVINHMKELKESQLDNVKRLDFIIEQLIYLLPFTFIILPGIVFFLIKKEFREYRILLSVSAVVLLLLLLLRGKSMYASGLYPFFIVVGSLFVEKVSTRKTLFISISGLLVILSILLLPLSLPVFKPAEMVHYFDDFFNRNRNRFAEKRRRRQFQKTAAGLC